jgi:hypothetical protein
MLKSARDNPPSSYGKSTNDDFNHPITHRFHDHHLQQRRVRNTPARTQQRTTNPGEPLPHAVWYQWTAPDTGT